MLKFCFSCTTDSRKIIKAWLSKIGVKYEKIHDLQILIAYLKDNSQNIPEEIEELENLTDFAVTFRYDVLENIDASSDRLLIIDKINRLLEIVRNLV